MHDSAAHRVFDLGIRRAAALGVAAMLHLVAVVSAEPSMEATTAEEGAVATSDDGRIIAHYDFEDAAVAPIEFPRHFRRTIDPARGMPPFGAIALDNRHAAEGDWSFHFQLERGSLSAGIPTGVLPILPLADYEVSVRVRTEDLRQSGAVLRAAFHDALGRRIPESEQRSVPLRTGGSWETVTLLLPGRFEKAADLVIDLELLQPAALRQPVEDQNLAAPRLEDIGGQAWFDELRVRHLPRLELRMENESTVIVDPERPVLELLVRDMAGVPVETWATVRDVDGRVVLHQLLTSSPPHTAVHMELELDRYGWYDATLLAANENGILRLARMPFLWLPPVPSFNPSDPGVVRPGLIAPSIRTDSLDELAHLVRGLRVRAVNIPVWDLYVDRSDWSGRWPELRRALNGMMERGARLTLAFHRLPRPLADRLNVNPQDVIEALARPLDQWKPAVEPVLLPFGIRVTRWQCGSIDTVRREGGRLSASALGGARRSMGSLVPGLELVIPVDADGPLLDPAVAPDVRVHVPYAVRPEAIETAVRPWMEGRNSVSVALEPLPAREFTPRQRAVDLALRAVHAWTLEPREILLEDALVDSPDGVQMDLTAAVWRTLADQLGGRRFAGAIDLGDDVHGWLFEGDNDLFDRPDTSLVVWTDHHPLGDARRVSLVLGSARMDASDVFGNASPVPFEDGAHQLVFDHSPVFVEGVDPKLIHFRHAMRVEPADLPTAHRAHDAAVIVANPWPSDIMVRLRIGESTLRVNPGDGELVIPSGEEARLPIQLIVPVGTSRGTHWVEASIELRAEHRYRLNARLPVTLDWPGIHSTVSWQLGPRRSGQPGGARDLLVIQQVTNLTDETLNLDVALRATGVPHMRRMIASLAPGMTASRAFQIPGGEARLSNRRVWVTLSDRYGPNQITEVLRIPPLIRTDDGGPREDAEDAQPLVQEPTGR